MIDLVLSVKLVHLSWAWAWSFEQNILLFYVYKKHLFFLEKLPGDLLSNKSPPFWRKYFIRVYIPLELESMAIIQIQHRFTVPLFYFHFCVDMNFSLLYFSVHMQNGSRDDEQGVLVTGGIFRISRYFFAIYTEW